MVWTSVSPFSASLLHSVPSSPVRLAQLKCALAIPLHTTRFERRFFGGLVPASPQLCMCTVPLWQAACSAVAFVCLSVFLFVHGPCRYPNATSLADDTWISSFHYTCVSESAGCLWDVVSDMLESTEVSASNPGVVDMMAQILQDEKATIYSVPHDNDPACKPYCMEHYGGFYGPWKEV